jgi:RHH-type proline utilization regulon transcriptional repressor/proline dehydrogenase/delta 1-pyrroline-5-carboxylate dehydrogenase
VLRVAGIGDLAREVFGPVLHVATFAADDIPQVIADINATGYGLTFGLHTRIDTRVEEVARAVRAGNVYVNRNQIGAVVGSQPFGGTGLSGTGPKAGGPAYLPRFCRAPSGEASAVWGAPVSARILADRIETLPAAASVGPTRSASRARLENPTATHACRAA